MSVPACGKSQDSWRTGTGKVWSTKWCVCCGGGAAWKLHLPEMATPTYLLCFS